MRTLVQKLLWTIMALEEAQKGTDDFEEEKLMNHAVYALKMLVAYRKRKERNNGNGN